MKRKHFSEEHNVVALKRVDHRESTTGKASWRDGGE